MYGIISYMYVFAQEVVESFSCQMSASFVSFGLGEVDGVDETTGKSPQSPASRPSPLAKARLEGQQLGAVPGQGACSLGQLSSFSCQ